MLALDGGTPCVGNGAGYAVGGPRYNGCAGPTGPALFGNSSPFFGAAVAAVIGP